MCAATQLSPEGGKWEPGPFVVRYKAFQWRQFKRDASQMLGCLHNWKKPLAESRIVDLDPSSLDCLQDHKMVHIPVHNRRQLQLSEVTKLEAQRSARKLHLGRHLNHGLERNPFQRHRMATPERVQVDAVAVVGTNHRQAGEPAFSCLGLPDNREVTPAAKIQEARHDHVLRLSSGSRNQLIKERFSRMISALRSISAWSGMRLP